MAHTSNPVRGLWTAQGARLVVSNQHLSLGIEGGIVYLNGVPLQALLDDAQARGRAKEVLEGIFEFDALFCNTRGLPRPTCIVQGQGGQTPSVRLGAEGADHVRAHPSGVVQIGSAGSEPLSLHPEPRIMFHGLGGVRVEPPPPALLAYPGDERERLLFTEGAVVGAVAVVVVGAALAWVFRALPRLACRVMGH